MAGEAGAGSLIVLDIAVMSLTMAWQRIAAQTVDRTVRLPADLDAQVVAFADESGAKFSEAVRELLTRGLAAAANPIEVAGRSKRVKRGGQVLDIAAPPRPKARPAGTLPDPPKRDVRTFFK